MAITSAICKSFKKEILEGVHDLRVDEIKVALYDSSATLNADTTEYSATNEVSGTGYTAGGLALTVVAPAINGSKAIVDFSDASWAASSITASGALIYNASQLNKAIAVISFGGSRASSAGIFRITFPAADADNAIIRIN